MRFVSENNFAALMGTSNSTAQKWAESGVYPSHVVNGIRGFDMEELTEIPEVSEMINGKWDEESHVEPLRQYTSVELFAGGGGLALGMSLAGFHHVLLNEFDTSACKTLRTNRPDWNVIEGDVRHIDFTPLREKVDFLSGGFPCQAFSYAGKQGGFNDTRGTLFFELARAVKEIRPKVFMGENVKGLTSHEDGKTFATICNVIRELGYTLVEPRVLKAIMYQVPQKRERLILIAIRNDIAKRVQFHWPSPYERVLTLRDALYKSVIFDKNVPQSEGVKYPEKKKRVLELVPQGGDWRDLPEDVARDYMGGSWLLGGGKTGMARRLSLDEPSLTLTCAPAQKQTERCHPLETRPLTVREYARIQTFPDYWQFQGPMSAKYKQIGNAVPVNLAWAIGRSLIRLFNDIQTEFPSETQDCTTAVREIMRKQSHLVEVKDNKTQTSKVEAVYTQLNFLDMLDEFEGVNSEAMMVREDEPIAYGRYRAPMYPTEFHEKFYIARGNVFDVESFWADGVAAFVKGGFNNISASYDEFKTTPHEGVHVAVYLYNNPGTTDPTPENVNDLVAAALNSLVEKGAKVITMPPINIVGVKAKEKDALTAQAVVAWLKDNGEKINRLIIVDKEGV